MTEIKVAGMDACNCSNDDIPYFVTSYKTLFPTSVIECNGIPVEFWDNKLKLIVRTSKDKMLIYDYYYNDGKCLYKMPVVAHATTHGSHLRK